MGCEAGLSGLGGALRAEVNAMGSEWGMHFRGFFGGDLKRWLFGGIRSPGISYPGIQLHVGPCQVTALALLGAAGP